ncbi:MAG: cytochrome c1 [Alphaproteobacteria bacterium]|nr:cytochrome c1 [Alphaproteobacteria bacterium]
MIARLTTTIAAVAVAAGAWSFAVSGPAQAAGPAIEYPQHDWSFSGPFGTFDRGALQRGFQVYKNICSGCHALSYVAYRNLEDLGYNEDEIKAIAAQALVVDGPNDDGEMFERSGIPADRFVSPFPNEKAARAANGGAYPPDLSLIVKARPDGANYLRALLVGYVDPPADFNLMPGMNYNAYFSGHQIAMAQPLWGDDVTFEDGTAATIEQQAEDLTTFLAWAAEPEMEERKRAGVMTILFLLVFTGLLYATKRKIWADVH